MHIRKLAAIATISNTDIYGGAAYNFLLKMCADEISMHNGVSPSGKAWGFGPHIHRFESDNPCFLVRFGS